MEEEMLEDGMMESHGGIVYIHGTCGDKDLWYRVEFAKTSPKYIAPVASLCHKTHGTQGGWCPAGNDIYYTGGGGSRGGKPRLNFIKHSILSPDITAWENGSASSMNIHHTRPTVSAIGRKLYVVGGIWVDTNRDDTCTVCGEVYDLDTGTWQYLKDFSHLVRSLRSYSSSLSVEEKRGLVKPNGFFFHDGFWMFDVKSHYPVLLLDLTGAHAILKQFEFGVGIKDKWEGPDFGDWLDDQGVSHTGHRGRGSLGGWIDPQGHDHHPTGLSDFPKNKVKMIRDLISVVQPVSVNEKLYWFSPDKRLCEYDILAHRWFISPCLKDQIPTFLLSEADPVLTYLGNGKFLLIFMEGVKTLSMVSLMVVREQMILRVHVQSTQSFAIGQSNFVPSDAKALIWAEQRQLDRANICLLNCGLTGCEILKNLVLDGVRKITIVDQSIVFSWNRAQNFIFGNPDYRRLRCVPRSEYRSKWVLNYLKDINDAVEVQYVSKTPEEQIRMDQSFFSEFDIVIATQLSEECMMKLDGICREANTMLVFAHSYGLMGRVRTSVKEHTVIESKPDHFPDDLRLNNPWTELKRFANTIDLNSADAAVHTHTPYVIILVKIAEEWANIHGGNLPSTTEEKNLFKDLIKSKMITMEEENYKEAMEASYKVFSPRGLSPSLQKIIDDNCTEIDFNSSDFWVMVAALKEFIANEGGGETPLEGSIPDMTSSTELYLKLQKIYKDKAERDFLVMEQRVRNLLNKIGRDTASISKAHIRSFCKNARKIAVCRYRSIEDEFNSLPDLQKYLTDEAYGSTVRHSVLLRAACQFAVKFPCAERVDSRLRTLAVGLLNDLGCDGSDLSEGLIDEMCRYSTLQLPAVASELPAVAAFVGGVAAQEVIKLITKQFIPMLGTFIFNGIDQKSQLLL